MRYQRGWLRVVERKQGRMWLLRYYAVDPVNGKKQERSQIIGSLTDFRTESACWREVDRQKLSKRLTSPGITIICGFGTLRSFT